MNKAAQAPSTTVPAARAGRGHDPNIAAVSLLRWLRRGVPLLLALGTIAVAWVQL
jgi:hypothetical protein